MNDNSFFPFFYLQLTLFLFFHIDECRTDDDDCQTLTCQHHGVCRLEFETKPNNKVSSRAYCECPLGFDGQFCETPVEIQASSRDIHIECSKQFK